MLKVKRGYRGMDTACKSVTVPSEIGTWLNYNSDGAILNLSPNLFLVSTISINTGQIY